MNKPLWKPKNPKKSQMYDFIQLINHNYNLKITKYEDLHNWSVNNISDFCKEIWNYGDIIYYFKYTARAYKNDISTNQFASIICSRNVSYKMVYFFNLWFYCITSIFDLSIMELYCSRAFCK